MRFPRNYYYYYYYYEYYYGTSELEPSSERPINTTATLEDASTGRPRLVCDQPSVSAKDQSKRAP